MGPRTDADDQNLDDLDREVTWLQPIADARLDDACADPAAVVAARAGLRLALVAALQQLPGRQRAVFILREVLKWPAREVAYVLQLSVAAVNSLLQRARRRIVELALDENQTAEPISVEIRRHVDRYAAAFEDGNAASLVALLLEDVTLEMPPIPTWFAGRRAVGRFLGQRMSGPSKTWLTVHTAANTQPAVGLYLRREDGTWHAESLHVLTVASRGIARIVAFRGPATFTAFQLPTVQVRATEIG